MATLPVAPRYLDSAARVPAPFGRLEVGRGGSGDEWIHYVWEGTSLRIARESDLLAQTVDLFEDFHHRSIPAPSLVVDDDGAPCGLGYRILPADHMESSTLEQFAAFYDGSMLNVHLVDFLRKLADAVLAVHRWLKRNGQEQHVGHGLLTPASVMVREDRSLRLAGLGLAHALRRTDPSMPRQFAELVGQIGFLAPEVRSGLTAPSTVGADVYAIGALAFFAATNVGHDDTSHTLDELNLNVSGRMVDIVRRCLAMDPKSRYAQVEDLVRALDANFDPDAAPLIPVNAPFARNEALLSSASRSANDTPPIAVDDARRRVAEAETDQGAPPAAASEPLDPAAVKLRYAKASAAPALEPTAPREPRMLLVQAGPFWRGSDRGNPDEAPARVVFLDAFYIAETAISADAYRQFLDETGGGDGDWLVPHEFSLVVPKLLGRKFRVAKGCEKLPANCATWPGAVAFCAWLSEKTGRPYRLPTEAEWERATRGPWGDPARSYPWGDDLPTPLRASFGRRWSPNPAETMAAVDALPDSAAPAGALQLAGNVWEWCSDYYDRAYYALNHSLANPAGPKKGYKRVARGGCWMSGPRELRCSARRGLSPKPDLAGAIGFRLAMSVPDGQLETAAATRSMRPDRRAE